MNTVTVCIYVKHNTMSGYNIPDCEGSRVYNLFKQLNDCAAKHGHPPLAFKLSVYLLPMQGGIKGKKGVEPEVTQKQFTDATKDITDFFKGQDDQLNISIVDFSVGLSQMEKQYIDRVIMPGIDLPNSSSGGDMLDMMKIKAIILNDGHNHLQCDSKSLIHNVDDFYRDTFNNGSTSEQFLVNLYGKERLTINNKSVYTSERSLMPGQWKVIYEMELSKYFCATDVQKSVKLLNMYNDVFSIGLVQSEFLNLNASAGLKRVKTINLDKKDNYMMTRHMLVAVDRDWQENAKNAKPECISIMERERPFSISALGFNPYCEFNYGCHQNLVARLVKMELDPAFKAEMRRLSQNLENDMQTWLRWIQQYESYCSVNMNPKDAENFDLCFSLNARCNQARRRFQPRTDDTLSSSAGSEAKQPNYGFFGKPGKEDARVGNDEIKPDDAGLGEFVLLPKGGKPK